MKNFLIFILIFTSYISFSQGEANNWYFGDSAGISFDTGTPESISSPSIKISTYEGCSSISDAEGKLLFYSDGSNVWNASHALMPNGRNLLGHPSSTQSAMVIPRPKSSTQYYLFTVGAWDDQGGTNGFDYYTIDMNADGGKGDIIAGPVNLSGLLSPLWTEKVAAVQGAECNTYWVVSYDGTNLKSYKVDENGVNLTPVVSPATANEKDRRGYLKISPNGKKIAIAHYLYYGLEASGELIPGGDSQVLLYDFNDLTGQITNPIEVFDDVNNKIHPYGLEFSRQSTKLYTSALIEQTILTDKVYNVVYQYDLENSDIPSTQFEIRKQIGYRGALQLGPNGKIYATVPQSYRIGTSFLDVINNPDELGLGSDYQEDVVNLGFGRATQGLPPFIASIFSPIEISTDDSSGSPTSLNGQLIDLCIGDNLTIASEPITGNVTYEWFFNGTSISPAENLELSNIDSNSIGDYKLEVSSIDECDRISYRQAYFSIESVNPPPIAYPVDNFLICDDDYTGTYEFNFNDLFSTTILDVQDPAIFEVAYYGNSTDAENDTNPLPVPFNSPNTTIHARVQNINNNNCFATTSFDINIYQSALSIETDSIESLRFCDNISVGTDTDGMIEFDLELRKMNLLNGQPDSDFTLTYYTDSNYTDISKIPNPNTFENTISGKQIIYVRKTNNLEVNCYTDTSFTIEVLKLPEIQAAITFKNCDDDGSPDGFTDFNLEEATDIITNKNPSLTATYHGSSIDATAGLHPLPFIYNNATSSAVFARVETVDGCHRISAVDLKVSTTAFPQGYLKELESCDDDDELDGLHLFDLTQASAEFIAQFPIGEPLEIEYYRTQEDAQLEFNKITDQANYVNETPFTQLIYVRVESKDNGNCFGIGPYLKLTVHPRPEFEVVPLASVCINLGTVTLETFNPKGDYSYQWFNPSNDLIGSSPTIEVSIGGAYNVIATSGLNCASFSQIITVIASDVANINENDITITDDSNNNTVSINNANQNLGIGDYEFSLDDEFGLFQDAPFFDRVLPGIHTIFVRDKNSCGLVSLDISVIGFPKFFTPNNDGQNDYWKVLGVNQYFFPTSLIYIYDRYGKILAKVNPHGKGWDGYYNGIQLPSDDYWFSVQLKNLNGVVKNKKGNFSIIRR